MMKHAVILSASPRKMGNSDILCHQFMKGAEEAGNTCELISLYDKKNRILQSLLCMLQNRKMCSE